MHEVLVNRLGGVSLSRKSVVRLTDMTLDVNRERKTTMQQQQQNYLLADFDTTSHTSISKSHLCVCMYVCVCVCFQTNFVIPPVPLFMDQF